MKRKHKYDIPIEQIKEFDIPFELKISLEPIPTSFAQSYFRKYIRIARLGQNGPYFRIIARHGGVGSNTEIIELLSMDGRILRKGTSVLTTNGTSLNVVSVDEFMSALTVLG